MLAKGASTRSSFRPPAVGTVPTTVSRPRHARSHPSLRLPAHPYSAPIHHRRLPPPPLAATTSAHASSSPADPGPVSSSPAGSPAPAGCLNPHPAHSQPFPASASALSPPSTPKSISSDSATAAAPTSSLSPPTSQLRLHGAFRCDLSGGGSSSMDDQPVSAPTATAAPGPGPAASPALAPGRRHGPETAWASVGGGGGGGSGGGVKLVVVVGVVLLDDPHWDHSDGATTATSSGSSRPVRVLLAQRPEGKSNAGLWEFPGGKVDPGETPEAALVRELREELRIGVAATDLAPLTFASHTYPTFHLLMPLYACRRWSGEPTGAEGQAVVWATADEMGSFSLTPADVPLVPAVLTAMRHGHGA